MGSLLRLPREDNNKPRSPQEHPLIDTRGYASFTQAGPPQRLLQGPRRVVRLCVFALLVPALLITVPLYVRLVLYPPGQYPMTPTDQRLISGHMSSFWCQGQWLQMTGNFNVYSSENKFPTTSTPEASTHLLHTTTLRDDEKEYWGFHLLRGSSVTISACASHPGAQVMILKGVSNLQRCAWIGESDSTENQDPDDDPTQTGTQIIDQPPHTQDTASITTTKNNNNTKEQLPIIPILDKSFERQQDLEQLLRKVLRLSKDKKEILRILHTVGRGGNRSIPKHLQRNFGVSVEENDSKQTKSSILRQKRDISAEDNYDGAFEEFDDDEIHKQGGIRPENNVGSRVVGIEHGHFNQTGQNDGSDEEDASSYSSSEEALAQCKGVEATLPVKAYRGCSPRWVDLSSAVYQVSDSATYYFVFWSDNEISSTTLHFNLSLTRVQYNTSDAKLECNNTNECVVTLSMWSHRHILVDMPPESSYLTPNVLHTACQSRVPVFLVLLILAPILILVCAFQ